MRIKLCQPWTPTRWMLTAIALLACIAANSGTSLRFDGALFGLPAASPSSEQGE